MADPTFDSTEIPGQPGLYNFYLQGSPEIMPWLQAMREEGEAVNRSDPEFDAMEVAIRYTMGDQHAGSEHPEIKRVTLNQCKKSIRAHVSALTDVKPMYAWKTVNDRFKDAADVLNQYNMIWWSNTFADMDLADCIRYALVAGSGDMVVEYDPNFNGGDNHLLPRDPRDTIPFRPTRGRSIQEWEGVTIRESWSPNVLLATYPDRRDAIRPDSGKFPGAYSRFIRSVSGKTGGPITTLSGLGAKDPNKRGVAAQTVAPECTFYRTYLNDRSRNTRDKDVLMGTPNTNWCYTVAPGELLYPNKRLITWTEYCADAPLYDGPSPYWHGLYPVTRLKLDPWPWLFFGKGILSDLRGVQDALNMVVNWLLQNISQAVNRGTIWDKNMPEGQFKRFNANQPNWKVRRPNQFSDGFKLAEVAPVPPWVIPFLGSLFQKFDELSGTANLQALLQLRQAPGANTVEKFMEALTPEIRLEGRQIEGFLREVAVQVKSNVFQFQTSSRRFVMLGDAGQVLEDLDYDPDNMIPALQPTLEDGSSNPEYTPELDASKPRHERAKFFMNQFAFFVTPNSMLAMTSMERKMTAIQLSRQGYLDMVTLLEIMEIPNVGSYPPIWLPVIGAEKEVNLKPGTQPPMEMRVPRTIIERLQAQQQLGLGQTVSPAGRKASGNAPPEVQAQPGGGTTVTESQ